MSNAAGEAQGRACKLLLFWSLLGACSETHSAPSSWEDGSGAIQSPSLDATAGPEGNLEPQPDEVDAAVDSSEPCSSVFNDPYFGKLVSSAWPVVSIPGPACRERAVVACEDSWGLRQELESIAGRCGFSADYDPLMLQTRDGCVIDMRFGPRSDANDPTTQRCLLDELGRIRFGCGEEAECVMLYRDTLALARSTSRVGAGSDAL